MSKLVDEHMRDLNDLHEGWKNRERELLAHIERLQAQLAEAKELYVTERTGNAYPYEYRRELEDDAREYFDRMMELTAKQQAQRIRGCEVSNWDDLSANAKETMAYLGDFGPTLNPENREVKGWVPDVDGSTRKIYWNSDTLREMAAAFTEVADYLDKRAELAQQAQGSNLLGVRDGYF